MTISTTTLGSYPRPGPLGGDPRHAGGETPPDAAAAIVRELDDLGIDVPCEGGTARPDPLAAQLGRFPGVSRSGETFIVRRAIRPGERYLRHIWREAQAATRKPVKMTLPGPLTLAAAVMDEHYGEERALVAALGDALNREIRDLADAGCAWIQVDEPAFARRPEAVPAFGLDAIARCFHKVARETWRAVYLPSAEPPEGDGRAERRDLEDEDGGDDDATAISIADPEAADSAAAAMADAPIHAIGLQHAVQPIDLRRLESFSTMHVMLGVVGTMSPDADNVETVRDRLRGALDHIDPERLVAAPDSGLGHLAHGSARRRVEALVSAARST